MGQNNQQHRAAKAKRRHQRAAGPPRSRPAADHTHPAPDRGWTPAAERRQQALEVLATLARRVAAISAADLPRAVRSTLLPLTPELVAEVEKVLVAELMARLSSAWQHGWQPADLRHGAAKRGARQGGIVAELITQQARATGAHRRAPQAWRDQLDLIAGSVSEPSTPTGDWRPVANLVASGVPEAAAWAEALGVLKTLAELRPLPLLMPPPSRWDQTVLTPTRAGSADRDRLLTRIRALLAKAEATDHPAEAETFTAKAQELMSRHAIDDALLHARDEESIDLLTRRVHLSSPYASTKVLLLSAVAHANRSRTIYLSEYAIASVVGTPVDIDQIEMLFTSLLIQATRAMAAAGQHRAGSFDRSPTFRRSFLTAYADRIGERLTEADRDTVASYGAELVPVLQRQAEAIEAEFDRQFPHTTTMNTGTLDARGWHAGRAAADEAVLVAGRLAR